MTIKEAVSRVRPLDAAAMRAAEKRFSDIAMPLGGLGLLQDAIIQLAGIQREPIPIIRPRAAVIFCADNGVVAEGVTQCGQDVTATVTRNMGQGRSTMCMMAKSIDMDVFPVDIGVAEKFSFKGVIDKKIRKGTENIAKNAAMTRAEAIAAVKTGIELAGKCAQQGFRLVCGGEMGIGNTTTSATVTAALTGAPASHVTGRGAGLSSEGLHKKMQVVEKALAINRANPDDPIDVISKVGGLDIAGLTGFYLGAAACGLPIVLDGVISCTAALAAVRLCPLVADYLIAAHCSEEPASALLLQELGKKAFITAGMHLGEGTGAAAGIALLDLALAPYRAMPTFDEIGVEAYKPLKLEQINNMISIIKTAKEARICSFW